MSYDEFDKIVKRWKLQKSFHCNCLMSTKSHIILFKGSIDIIVLLDISKPIRLQLRRSEDF